MPLRNYTAARPVQINSGQVVMAWEANESSLAYGDIGKAYARLFSATGNPMGMPFEVSPE